jgi:predicted TPR repeat methyltransferase
LDKRRGEVLKTLVNDLDLSPIKVGEIGCGNGLVQKQFETLFSKTVDGFELDEYTLKESIASDHPLYCYNILERHESLKEAYDFIILFDVIEHIPDEDEFIDAVLFHLKPSGYLAVNVPAFMFFYSVFDEVVGHQRRYSLRQLSDSFTKHNLTVFKQSYWGLCMVPLFLLRKWMFKVAGGTGNVVKRGLSPRSSAANSLLY